MNETLNTFHATGHHDWPLRLLNLSLATHAASPPGWLSKLT